MAHLKLIVVEDDGSEMYEADAQIEGPYHGLRTIDDASLSEALAYIEDYLTPDDDEDDDQ